MLQLPKLQFPEWCKELQLAKFHLSRSQWASHPGSFGNWKMFQLPRFQLPRIIPGWMQCQETITSPNPYRQVIADRSCGSHAYSLRWPI